MKYPIPTRLIWLLVSLLLGVVACDNVVEPGGSQLDAASAPFVVDHARTDSLNIDGFVVGYVGPVDAAQFPGLIENLQSESASIRGCFKSVNRGDNKYVYSRHGVKFPKGKFKHVDESRVARYRLLEPSGDVRRVINCVIPDDPDALDMMARWVSVSHKHNVKRSNLSSRRGNAGASQSVVASNAYAEDPPNDCEPYTNVDGVCQMEEVIVEDDEPDEGDGGGATTWEPIETIYDPGPSWPGSDELGGGSSSSGGSTAQDDACIDCATRDVQLMFASLVFVKERQDDVVRASFASHTELVGTSSWFIDVIHVKADMKYKKDGHIIEQRSRKRIWDSKMIDIYKFVKRGAPSTWEIETNHEGKFGTIGMSTIVNKTIRGFSTDNKTF